MQDTQEFCCAICGGVDLDKHSPTGKAKALHTDHDHHTGKVRGLLCVGCNSMLGRVHDSVATFQNAVQYLLDHQLTPTTRSSHESDTD